MHLVPICILQSNHIRDDFWRLEHYCNISVQKMFRTNNCLIGKLCTFERIFAYEETFYGELTSWNKQIIVDYVIYCAPYLGRNYFPNFNNDGYHKYYCLFISYCNALISR